MPIPQEPVGTSLGWTTWNTGKFFLIFYLCCSCCSWSPILTLLAEGTRIHLPLLFASALHGFGNLFCSAQSLFRPHSSLSQLYPNGKCSTPPATLYAPLWAFPSQAIGFLRYGNCPWAKTIAKWNREVVPCLLQCASQNRHPRTAGFLQHWVSAVLPSNTVLDLFFPYGRSLANCSSSCIWEIDFNSPARECNILITSVDKVCCSHSDLDLRDK